MKRNLMMLGLVLMISLVYGSEVRSGGMACADCYTSFIGPAFSATVVLNADWADSQSLFCQAEWSCPNQGTVAITLSKGKNTSGAIFVSPYVANLSQGCDGKLGAVPGKEDDPYMGVDAKTNVRFVGLANWIPENVLSQLLAPFGLTPDPSHPLVFSDIDHAVCTQVPIMISDTVTENAWILSFTGTMQFGVTKKIK